MEEVVGSLQTSSDNDFDALVARFGEEYGSVILRFIDKKYNPEKYDFTAYVKSQELYDADTSELIGYRTSAYSNPDDMEDVSFLTERFGDNIAGAICRFINRKNAPINRLKPIDL